MERLDEHMHKILTFLLEIESVGGRLQQMVMDRNRLLEEGELIKDRCKQIKTEVKRMAMLSENFRKLVDEEFRIH